MTKKLLTTRKQKWVQARKPDLIKGEAINPSAAVASRYYEKLKAIIDQMTDETERHIKNLFKEEHAKEYFAMDASISSQARILTNALFKRFTLSFAAKAKPIAESFADQANSASSTQVHSSIKELSGGLSLATANLDGQLKDMLSATITENVGLIKSIPQEYLTAVQGAVMRSITQGNGLQDLVPFLEKHKEITLRRAQLIALDQNRKAMNNLSKGRMQNLGLKKFMWLHTGGSQEPRKLHQEYNGNVFSFDDLPVIDERTGERGIPGTAINCRCRMKPVIQFDD